MFTLNWLSSIVHLKWLLAFHWIEKSYCLVSYKWNIVSTLVYINIQFLPINASSNPIYFGLWWMGNVMKWRWNAITPEMLRNEAWHMTQATIVDHKLATCDISKQFYTVVVIWWILCLWGRRLSKGAVTWQNSLLCTGVTTTILYQHGRCVVVLAPAL